MADRAKLKLKLAGILPSVWWVEERKEEGGEGRKEGRKEGRQAGFMTC